jgi:signal transduction histidine kinase
VYEKWWKNMSNQISIFKYVHKSQSSFRWLISLTLTAVISLSIGGISLSNKISSNQKILNAISPYLMAQVEVNDRTEINRILNSITKSEDSKLVLVKDGKVFSTTGDLQELDLPFNTPVIKLELLNGLFSKNEIIVKSSLRRNSSSMDSIIYYYTPLAPIIKNVIGIMVIVLLASILVSLLVSLKTRRTLKKALMPLEQLHSEIRSLNLGNDNSSAPIRIKELEDIRQTIISTRADLEVANEKIATQKAKELTSEAYKQLIHDLHNPVAALRQMVRIQTSIDADEESKLEALELVPQIAQEILEQVTAAKKNLENDPNDFQEVDLRNCLRESFFQVRSAFKEHQDKIVLNLPEFPVLVKHDPIMLKRAIINLLENGLEASRSKVELSLDSTDIYTSIKVSDDGNGIAEDKVSLYLQGRGQSSKGNRQAFGLSSTNHIARTHGGRIIYQKNNLGGASFEIRLEAQ